MYDISISKTGLKLAAHMLDAGVLVNDHYDTAYLDVNQYLRETLPIRQNEFANKQFKQYFSVIRSLERERPQAGNTEACIAYREKTNLISLAVNASLAFEIPLDTLINISDKANPEITSDTPNWFTSLYYVIMALQVVDDLIGYRGDTLHHRPSFFTAYGLLPNEYLGNKDIYNERLQLLNTVFNTYVAAAREANKTFVDPMIVITKTLMTCYPKLVHVLQIPGINRISRVAFSKREINDQ